jgi:hypothetical protein
VGEEAGGDFGRVGGKSKSAPFLNRKGVAPGRGSVRHEFFCCGGAGEILDG